MLQIVVGAGEERLKLFLGSGNPRFRVDFDVVHDGAAPSFDDADPQCIQRGLTAAGGRGRRGAMGGRRLTYDK